MFPRLFAIACAWLLLVVGTADARIREAGSVLPPGQSGFVTSDGLATGRGSPHLIDQTDLFNGFGLKNAMLSQGDTTDGTSSPKAGVTITRDKYGVPTITGETTYDAWFGSGYAVAEDRLVQLEFFRRATSGRLGEILGTSYREDDFIARRDYYTAAEYDAQFNQLPPDLKERFQAYADGINARLAEVRLNPTLVPGEFAALGILPDNWTVRDSVAIGVYLARTVPSSDGAELPNARALKALGPAKFDQLLPLRTPGQIPTIADVDGSFPSQPGRTVRQERAAFKRSQRFLQGLSELPTPPEPADKAAQRRKAMAGIGRKGGSMMWAIRMPGGGATYFNGPQLGFQIPELFVELEVHGPSLNLRGATAPGTPVVATGHNEHVAWGVTSGLNDDDDLYVETLNGGQDSESYTYKGQQRQMDCRDEVFNFRANPTSPGGPPVSTETRRICRTVHGPVQERAGGRAFARRYAIWGREIDTLAGLAQVNDARDIADVDKAADQLTWNENLMAADDKGNIGYWHPGLLQLGHRNWDERLPLPGTGEAEWRGFLPPRQRPQVVNPKSGYLFNWNNVPSAAWTNGDSEARERATGPFHRAAWLARQVKSAHRRGGGFDRSKRIDYNVGTIAQQRPISQSRLRRVRKSASGTTAELLDVILKWNGSYVKVDSANTVDPGVAAWEQFKTSAKRVALGRSERDAEELEGGGSSSHQFDITNLEAFALRTLSDRGYRQAAKLAHAALTKQYGSSDPAKWREPRRVYEPSAQGAGSFPEPFYFFDRGTYSHNNELGP